MASDNPPDVTPNDVIPTVTKHQARANYPKQTCLLLMSQFCERFTYYGIKAVIVIYLTRALDYNDDTATAIYHAFNVLCYFTPVVGAMLADGWLGKFRTILSMSILYAVGAVLITATSVPTNGVYVSSAMFIGLFLIATGTGAIKPCITALCGDQFQPHMTRQKDSFFSWFYMVTCVGGLVAIVSTVIRSGVFCFYDNCYCLVFGLPAILMCLSIVLFVIGWRWYIKVPPQSNILGRILGCTVTAVKGRLMSKCERKDHWLDYADHKYDKQFIADMKDVTRVLWLFLPLPVFWALYDQQGSRWTIQATEMNGNYGSFQIQPDQMKFLNALLVIIFVPLLERVVFPVLDKLHIPHRPLQRMVWGMIFAATAFIISAFVQIAIDSAVPAPASVGQTKLMFINAAPCDVTVRPLNHTNTDEITLLPLTSSEYLFLTSQHGHVFEMRKSGASCNNETEFVTYLLDETKSYNMLFTGLHSQTLLFEQEKVSPTEKSASTIRLFNGLELPVNVTLASTNHQDEPQTFRDIPANGMSQYSTLVYANFNVELSAASITSRTFSDAVVSRNGAVYTILITGLGNVSSAADLENVTVTQITDMGPRTVNIFLQVPQYVVITVGEVLFSVTGLAFAYSQSPVSMKSLLQAAWLLTICFGNVIVIIVAEVQYGTSALSQTVEYFMFAGLLLVFTAIFIAMSIFYNYVDHSNVADQSDGHSGSVSSSSSTVAVAGAVAGGGDVCNCNINSYHNSASYQDISERQSSETRDETIKDVANNNNNIGNNCNMNCCSVIVDAVQVA